MCEPSMVRARRLFLNSLPDSLTMRDLERRFENQLYFLERTRVPQRRFQLCACPIVALRELLVELVSARHRSLWGWMHVAWPCLCR